MLEYQRGNYLHQNSCSALLPPIVFRNLLTFTNKGIMGFFVIFGNKNLNYTPTKKLHDALQILVTTVEQENKHVVGPFILKFTHTQN
jgi:5-enolpyruvylshikimate-3-phosphate synthase